MYKLEDFLKTLNERQLELAKLILKKGKLTTAKSKGFTKWNYNEMKQDLSRFNKK